MCHPYQASALCPPKYNFSVLLLIGSVSCPGRYFLLIPLILVESIWMALRKIELELLTWQVCKITLRRTSIIKYLRVLQTFLCLKNTAWLEVHSKSRSSFLAFRFWKYFFRIFWISLVSVVVFTSLSLTLLIWIFSAPPFLSFC